MVQLRDHRAGARLICWTLASGNDTHSAPGIPGSRAARAASLMANGSSVALTCHVRAGHESSSRQRFAPRNVVLEIPALPVLNPSPALLLFAPMWPDFFTAIANARAADLVYSLGNVPMLLVPIVAWWGRGTDTNRDIDRSSQSTEVAERSVLGRPGAPAR